jgi:hypothetical protein
MTGDEVRQVFEAMLPPEEIDRLGEPFGVLERERKLHLGRLVRALVISAGTPGGADQAEVLRSYLECEVPHGARAAFSRWFDAPLEQCMEALAQRALAYARGQQGALSGPLGGGQDWSIVDATTVTGRDARREDCPGTGDAAAITGHTVLSVGCHAPGRDQVRPARAHDSRHLTIEESWRGSGLLADLGYASLERRRACAAPAVRFVIRLKDHWQPKLDYGARGQVTQEFFPGTAFDALREDETRVRDGRAMDADVPVGPGTSAWPLRRVGVQTPQGEGCVRTHLPPRSGPPPVADL